MPYLFLGMTSVDATPRRQGAWKGWLRAMRRALLEAYAEFLFRIGIVSCAAKTRWGASLFYALLSPEFGREHQAVLRGKLAYRRSLLGDSGCYYLLRRNAHRLEKGLIMRPRRAVFAKDYIAETVEAYATAMKHGGGGWTGSSEHLWVRDVLRTYFTATGSDTVLDANRQRFDHLLNAEAPLAQPEHHPYRRDLKEPCPVTYEQLFALARRRRSVRWFLQKPVPRELMDQAIGLALQAPSACNRQPFSFHIFDDPDLVQEVSSIPMGTVGFNQNFPVIVVIIGTLEAYPSERDRHVIYIDGALAAMSFMFALETLGLSSCPINWPDIGRLERKMAKALELSGHERPIMLVAVGYPDAESMVPYSGKKEVASVRRYNLA